MTTWLGIDGTNWVHVIWHAKGGRDVTQTVVDRAEALVRRLEPAAAVACFDRRSFRHDLIDGYKGDRKPRPAGLLDCLRETEAAIGQVCTVAYQDGFEADDCLATLAAAGRPHGVDVILATPDKDLRQCLSGRCRLLKNFTLRSGDVCNGDWYTEMSLFDEHGIAAAQWPDFQALVGDRGDSIEGAKGWGEKTAAAALAKCGSLEKCLANPWAVPCTDRQRNELLKFKVRVELVLQLVTLRQDVPAVFDALR